MKFTAILLLMLSIPVFSQAKQTEAGTYIEADRLQDLNDEQMFQYNLERDYKKWEERKKQERHPIDLKDSDKRVEELQRQSKNR